jgi:hypothetical protein
VCGCDQARLATSIAHAVPVFRAARAIRFLTPQNPRALFAAQAVNGRLL